MPTEDVINFIKDSIENSIKEDEELFGTKIDYILINPDNNDTVSIISNGVDKIVEFTPFTKEMKTGYSKVPEWDYSFDNYLFKDLKNVYQIGYMTAETHYNIWCSIDELYPEDINNKDGVQWYLQFCADNGITKEFLDKQTNLDTPDIMKHFEGLAFQETMTYKGYVIEADDTNFDNPKENIVTIYKSQQDYIDGNYAENVSLNTVGLKQNIKEYIDEVYIDKADLESEKAYFTFVLGYDLLHDMINKYGVLECDTNYDFCDYVANQFLDSKEYSNFNRSSYEMLQEWLSNNKERIEAEYKETIGYEEKVYNGNLKILKTGFRKDEPIALVEKDVPSMNRKEYIVAFNYTIDEEKNNLIWGYGRYYYDKTSGVKAYEKVINGGNLAFHNREER